MKYKLNTYTGSFIYKTSIFKWNRGQVLTKSPILLIATEKINKSTGCWKACSEVSHEVSQTRLCIPSEGSWGRGRGLSTEG